MKDTESLILGFCIGIMVGIVLSLAFTTSETLKSKAVSEYKSGEIVCAEVGKELICRSAE